MNTLVPQTKIILGTQTLTEWGLRPFLRSVTCSRSAAKTPWTKKDPKGRPKRDMATLVFDNTEHQVARYIAMREHVEIYMGYGFGGADWHRGSYLTYNPAVSYGANDMSISVTCQDASIKLMENQAASNRKWSGRFTLEQIAKRVAVAYHMDLDIHESLRDHVFVGMSSERHESDWHFLQRLTDQTGAGVVYVRPATVVKGNERREAIVIRPFGFELPETPVRAKPEPVKLGYRDPYSDVPIGSASVKLDVEKGLKAVGGALDDVSGKFLAFKGSGVNEAAAIEVVTELPDGGSSRRALFGKDAEDIGEAGAFFPPGLVFLRDFERSLKLWKSFAIELSLQLPIAAPFLYPLQLIELSGLGPFSGKAIITTIQDKFGMDGYSQSLTAVSSSMLDNVDTTSGFHVLAFKGSGVNEAAAIEVVTDAADAVAAEGDGVGR